MMRLGLASLFVLEAVAEHRFMAVQMSDADPPPPQGAKVVKDGQEVEVFYLPTIRPTVAPDRPNNFNPVMSPVEKLHEKWGPTPPPDRDCVRAPGRGMCGCKEMIDACHAQVYTCDKRLMELKEEVSIALRDNHQSKFAHPLLNTLALNSSVMRQPAKPKSALVSVPEQCRMCFDKLQQELPHEGMQFLQEGARKKKQPPKPSEHTAIIMPNTLKYEPNPFGWRVYDESPSFDTILAGVCSSAEMEGLEGCLSYFWACDANLNRVNTWLLNTKGETKYIDSHPGTRPGIY